VRKHSVDFRWNKKSNPEPWNKFKQTDGYKVGYRVCCMSNNYHHIWWKL